MAIELHQEPLLEWQVFLGEKLNKKRVPVLIFVFLAGVVGFLMVNWWGFFIGVGAVFVSTAELWLPIKYRLTQEEAIAKCGLSVSAIRWENVRRIIDVEDGIRLSPLEKTSRLEEFRGVYLRFSSNRDEVLAKIAELTEQHGSSLDREVVS